MQRVVPLLLALLVTQAPGPLAAGKALADELQYTQAAEVLQAGREDSALPRATRLELLQVLGRCLLALGRRPQAEAVYAELLTLHPTATLEPDASPKLTATFDEVKARLYPANYVALALLPGLTGRVRIRLVDPWRRVQVVNLMLRRGRGAPFVSSPFVFEEADQAEQALPLADTDPVEWFVEARGAEFQVVASEGSAQAPFVVASRVSALGVPRPSRWVRPHAWAAAVVAVIGLGVGIGLQWSSRQLDVRSRDMSMSVDVAFATYQLSVRDAIGATVSFVSVGVAALLAALFFALP